MPLESDRPERQARYAPTNAARWGYFSYLLLEPHMEEALELIAALEEDQREVLLKFLRSIAPGERLALDRDEALVKGSRA